MKKQNSVHESNHHEEEDLSMNYEKIPEHLLKLEKENKFLEIKNLRKTFGKFVAVHGLNLNMYMG